MRYRAYVVIKISSIELHHVASFSPDLATSSFSSCVSPDVNQYIFDIMGGPVKVTSDRYGLTNGVG